MHPYTIIFIGPQGSGKGTQIERLDLAIRRTHPTERVVTIQTGRLFRRLAQKQETYTGTRLKETLDTGVLPPHFLAVALWGEVMMREVDPRCHLLIDGFPRTLEQAHVLEGALSFYKRNNLTIVNLMVSDDIARARMQSRARPDDTEAAITERLRFYRAETVPALDFYRIRPNTRVLDIDATLTIEEIHEAIVSGLGLAHSVASPA